MTETQETMPTPFGVVAWRYEEVRPGAWDVRFLNFDGDYELTGPGPMQGVGTVLGIDFYFRARRDGWEFETNDERGWLFPRSDARAFERRGECQEAEHIRHGAAASRVARCVAEFVARQQSTNTVAANSKGG